MAHRTRNKQRGFGFIEVLVSSLILAISILAALSLYGFSMSMIDKTGNEGVAYNLTRLSIENAREAGFSNTLLPDGDVTLYYNSVGQNPTNSVVTGSNGSRFRVLRHVSTDKLAGGAPAPDAIRTVTVKVYLVTTGEQIEQSWTLICRAGV